MEIDYKEKYMQAMERAKNFIENGDERERTIAESIFAGIMEESEDERIGKALMQNLKERFGTKGNMGEGLDMPDVLDWLEKKVEQKPTQKTEPFEAEHGKYYYCIKDYFCGGRKQASKGDVIQALRGLPIMGLKDASEYFLPANFIKCNSVWGYEDERNLDWLTTVCERIHYKSDPQVSSESALMLKEWLKSLKDRVQHQPQQEWSEEDEKMLQNVLECLKHGWKKLPTDILKYESWLKSLRPQSHWKPTGEQMEYLAKAIATLGDEGNCKTASILNDLRVELKKLREG